MSSVVVDDREAFTQLVQELLSTEERFSQSDVDASTLVQVLYRNGLEQLALKGHDEGNDQSVNVLKVLTKIISNMPLVLDLSIEKPRCQLISWLVPRLVIFTTGIDGIDPQYAQTALSCIVRNLQGTIPQLWKYSIPITKTVESILDHVLVSNLKEKIHIQISFNQNPIYIIDKSEPALHLASSIIAILAPLNNQRQLPKKWLALWQCVMNGDNSTNRHLIDQIIKILVSKITSDNVNWIRLGLDLVSKSPGKQQVYVQTAYGKILLSILSSYLKAKSHIATSIKQAVVTRTSLLKNCLNDGGDISSADLKSTLSLFTVIMGLAPSQIPLPKCSTLVLENERLQILEMTKNCFSNNNISPLSYQEVNVKSLISSCYPEYSDNDNGDIITQLINSNNTDEPNMSLYLNLACAQAGTLKRKQNQFFICSLCDTPSSVSLHSRSLMREIYQIMTNFIQNYQSKYKLEALSRLLNHCEPSDNDDSISQFIIESLSRPERSIRLLAAITVPKLVTKANVTNIVSHLNELNDSNQLYLKEACIIAWARLGCFTDNDDLNIVLMRLVQWLGNGDSYFLALAFTQLDYLCKIKNITPWVLMAPFWPSISYYVVQQVKSRPQLIQILSDLLNIGVNDFLVRTQKYTLPYLILSGRIFAVKRIATAAKLDIKDIIMANISQILAVLLVQDVDHVEKHTMELLKDACSKFQSVTLSDLTRSYPIACTCEVLKLSDDEYEVNHEKIQHALRLMAILDGKPYSRLSNKAASLEGFFGQYILGIVAHLSDAINDVHGKVYPREKRRYLKAMECMMSLSGAAVSSAIPQICACLVSALANPPLSFVTMSCWNVLLSSIRPSDVENLIDPTFAMIKQKWDIFDEETRKLCQSLIESVIKSNIGFFHTCTGSQLTDLSPILPMLAKDIRCLLAKDGKPTRLCMNYINRCSHENAFVVREALESLENLLINDPDLIQQLLGIERSSSKQLLLKSLIEMLFSISRRMRLSHPDICQIAARCFGIVAYVDASLFDNNIPILVSDLDNPVVVHNFSNNLESKEFAFIFLRKYLVPAFRTSTDSTSQGFLAFAIQELLKICDIDAQIATRSTNNNNNNNTSNSNNHNKNPGWFKLDSIEKCTLTPFLTSRYYISGSSPKLYHYPIYTGKGKISYFNWIHYLVGDLLVRAPNSPAGPLFSIIRKIIKVQDLNLCQFLLPYAIVNVIINGTQQDTDNVVNEFLTVLGQEPPSQHKNNNNEVIKKEDDIKPFCQTVFLTLDYLGRWIRSKNKFNTDMRIEEAKKTNKYFGSDLTVESDPTIEKVQKVLSVFDPKLVGNRCFQCGSYARALFYMESYAKELVNRQCKDDNEESMDKLYKEIQQIYTKLDDPDAIEGISSKFTAPSLDQQAMEHENANRLDAAECCYEFMLSNTRGGGVDDDDDANQKKPILSQLLNIMAKSGNYNEILERLDTIGEIAEPSWIDFAVESSWRLEKWDNLKKWLSFSNELPEKNNSYNTIITKDVSFQVSVGRIFNYMLENDMVGANKEINSAVALLANSVAYSKGTSLRQYQPDLFRLSVLMDLRGYTSIKSNKIIATSASSSSNVNQDFTLFNAKLNFLQPAVSEQSFLLNLHRVASNLVEKTPKSNAFIGKMWVLEAKIARKSNQDKVAYSCVLRALKYNEPSAHYEHCRLLWKQGLQRQAIRQLSSLINDNGLPKQLLAKAKLSYARWMDDSGQGNTFLIIHKYQEAVNANSKWESGHYYLGNYYNKLIEAEEALPMNLQNNDHLQGEYVCKVCYHYTNALFWGVKFVYQTLPRMLTLWLDLIATLHDRQWIKDIRSFLQQEDEQKSIISKRKANAAKIHEYFFSKYESLPKYLFYLAMSQMVSRLSTRGSGHSKQITSILVRIISGVAEAYPKQALWYILPILKSSDEDRKQAGKKIIYNLEKPVALQNLATEAQEFAQQLHKICENPLPDRRYRIRLSEDLNYNPKVCPCNLVIPNRINMIATLPTITGAIKKHNPFPYASQVTIHSIDDVADVMASLQKPRRIIIRGSDGASYPFLCKPKDDLRKDARMMEVNEIVNRYLKKDPSANLRRLVIRTYHVVPLTESCGVIEWVPDIRTLKDILTKAYANRHLEVNLQKMKSELDRCTPETFVTELLPKLSPVLYEWFIESFPEPSMWLAARNSFARTAAVMSMIGYVVGLGDRHCENILLDENSGEVVHVDFSCLFDRALSLAMPERVPFRLTQNIVDAFGISGYDGTFRASCEITQRIIRTNQAPLMCILESFLHDPIVDWANSGKKSAANAVMRTRNLTTARSPEEALSWIKRKIRGLHGVDSIPLSVEGQVDDLIGQATNPENLCRMYVGWLPPL